MVTVRTLLDRFRPSGAPGPATATGVPSDRTASVAAELAPVFDALAETMAECERLREAGRRDATARTRQASDEAEAVLAQARVDTDAERAAEAARLRARAAAEAGRVLAEAERAAQELRTRADARRPEVVAQVAVRVRARIEGAS